MDSSHDDMMVDFYAAYYDQLKASGKTEMFEDDDFDLNAILSELEAKEERPDPLPDEWEDVEAWDLKKHPNGLSED